MIFLIQLLLFLLLEVQLRNLVYYRHPLLHLLADPEAEEMVTLAQRRPLLLEIDRSPLLESLAASSKNLPNFVVHGTSTKMKRLGD